MLNKLFGQTPIAEKATRPQAPVEECPENSRCSSKGAEAFRAWSDSLNNKHMIDKKVLQHLEKRYGIPLNFWSTKKIIEKEKSDLSLLTWDSACPNHQKEGFEIGISKIFITNFSPPELKKLEQQGFITDLAIIKIAPKKFLSWKVPRGDTPLYLNKNGGLFISDLLGTYFYYRLTKTGIKIMSDDKKSHQISPAISINCPEDLKNKYHEELPDGTLFTSSFCKSIWDDDAKTYRAVIFSKACP